MTSQYDVVVVGGGIQGVGIAQAAAAEGQSVLVLEKSRLASGTSSKSSKLIHGGLRYLESAEFSLVRECLRERAILLKIAPDLVKLRRFIIPIYEQTRRSKWHVGLGLGLYYALTGFSSRAKPGIIKKQDWDQLDGIQTKGLHSVFYYSDAQTDDTLLTEAVMRSAQSLGAELKAPCAFLHANIQDTGVEVGYLEDGIEQTCHARVLVNAGGPWVNRIAQKVTPAPQIQPIDLVGGTHIIVDGAVNEGIYYVECPRDGRAIFVMPWYGQTMVGTTERTFRDRPDLIKPTFSEKNYLLTVLKQHFPQYESYGVADIADAWAGLRVLPSGKGHAFHRTREVILKTDRKKKPRVLSVYGGKLTAYRATAQEVMKEIRPSLVAKPRRGYTDKLPLTPKD